MSTRNASNENAALFDISTVARFTGLTTANIRIWEKRYKVVEPQRSESGRRLYTGNDVRRLTLLKSLADKGHPIRSTAPLSDNELETSLREATAESAGTRTPDSGLGKCRVALIGHHLISLFDEEEKGLDGTTTIAEFENLEAAEAISSPFQADLLIVECPALFPETAQRVRRLIERTHALRAVVVYDFAQHRTIEMMDQSPTSRTTAIQAPVNLSQLRIACATEVAIANRPAPSDLDASPEPEELRDIPERNFSDRQIAQISRISTAIDCECPQHLAGLLKSLVGFEKYSQECENRNSADAEAHAYLHRKTAYARSVVEDALTFLVDFEGIELDP